MWIFFVGVLLFVILLVLYGKKIFVIFVDKCSVFLVIIYVIFGLMVNFLIFYYVI